MTPPDIGQCAECGAPHDNGSRLDHCAKCGNGFDHCVCETVREEAERAERDAAERDWAGVSDWGCGLPCWSRLTWHPLRRASWGGDLGDHATPRAAHGGGRD